MCRLERPLDQEQVLAALDCRLADHVRNDRALVGGYRVGRRQRDRPTVEVRAGELQFAAPGAALVDLDEQVPLAALTPRGVGLVGQHRPVTVGGQFEVGQPRRLCRQWHSLGVDCAAGRGRERRVGRRPLRPDHPVTGSRQVGESTHVVAPDRLEAPRRRVERPAHDSTAPGAVTGPEEGEPDLAVRNTDIRGACVGDGALVQDRHAAVGRDQRVADRLRRAVAQVGLGVAVPDDQPPVVGNRDDGRVRVVRRPVGQHRRLGPATVAGRVRRRRDRYLVLLEELLLDTADVAVRVLELRPRREGAPVVGSRECRLALVVCVVGDGDRLPPVGTGADTQFQVGRLRRPGRSRFAAPEQRELVTERRERGFGVVVGPVGQPDRRVRRSGRRERGRRQPRVHGGNPAKRCARRTGRLPGQSATCPARRGRRDRRSLVEQCGRSRRNPEEGVLTLDCLPCEQVPREALALVEEPDIDRHLRVHRNVGFRTGTDHREVRERRFEQCRGLCGRCGVD